MRKRKAKRLKKVMADYAMSPVQWEINIREDKGLTTFRDYQVMCQVTNNKQIVLTVRNVPMNLALVYCMNYLKSAHPFQTNFIRSNGAITSFEGYPPAMDLNEIKCLLLS